LNYGLVTISNSVSSKSPAEFYSFSSTSLFLFPENASFPTTSKDELEESESCQSKASLFEMTSQFQFARLGLKSGIAE
jgi:hypothetical protein